LTEALAIVNILTRFSSRQNFKKGVILPEEETKEKPEEKIYCFRCGDKKSISEPVRAAGEPVIRDTCPDCLKEIIKVLR